jgi:hypothetical protein
MVVVDEHRSVFIEPYVGTILASRLLSRTDDDALHNGAFLDVAVGAGFFTDAVIMSPSPAFKPVAPPRGRMHDSLLAPELSATSRIVRI